jgi:hypothetical protein
VLQVRQERSAATSALMQCYLLMPSDTGGYTLLSVWILLQVRQEERSAAKSALMQAIAKSKQQVDAKYGKQLQQTSSQPEQIP